MILTSSSIAFKHRDRTCDVRISVLIQDSRNLTNTSHNLCENAVQRHVIVVAVHTIGSCEGSNMLNSATIQTSRSPAATNLIQNHITRLVHLIDTSLIPANLRRSCTVNLYMQVPIRLSRIAGDILTPAQAMCHNTVGAILSNYRVPLSRIPAGKIVITVVI